MLTVLPDYDAEAIAEVLGIAFRRARGTESVVAPPRPGTNSSRPQPQSQGSQAEVFDQGDASAIQIVDAGVGARASGYPRDSELWEGSPPASSVLIEKAVENGLPRFALRHVAEWLSGGDATRIPILEWGVVPKTTLDRRNTRLSATESERTERIARLFVHARRALGTVDEARAFMTSAHPELDGRSPIQAAKTDLGTRRTEQLLTALEFGLAL